MKKDGCPIRQYRRPPQRCRAQPCSLSRPSAIGVVRRASPSYVATGRSRLHGERAHGLWRQICPRGCVFHPRRSDIPPICGLHHRSSFFLRLRSRLARQCQERTCRQGAVHERANEQLYPREPRTCLPTPSGSRSLADLAQSWGHHPSLRVCGAGRNFLWALPRASCRSAQPNCRLKVRVTPKADDIR